MSQENVEIVQRSLEAYSRRDLKALRAISDPEVELDWSASRGALAGVYQGIDEVLRFYVEWYEIFEMTIIEPERFIQIADSVVVPNVARMRGRDGIEVSARSTLVTELRNHKITRTCLYQGTDEALKAVDREE
jgi:ketosteroid isomerase-like protein